MTLILQFIDEAHARLYDLGRVARADCPINAVAAEALRDRIVRFMDLTDAGEDMDAEEQAELRAGAVRLGRFIAWAMEFADAVDAGVSPACLYDPDQLGEVMMSAARGRGATIRVAQFQEGAIRTSPG